MVIQWTETEMPTVGWCFKPFLFLRNLYASNVFNCQGLKNSFKVFWHLNNDLWSLIFTCKSFLIQEERKKVGIVYTMGNFIFKTGSYV